MWNLRRSLGSGASGTQQGPQRRPTVQYGFPSLRNKLCSESNSLQPWVTGNIVLNLHMNSCHFKVLGGEHSLHAPR